MPAKGKVLKPKINALVSEQLDAANPDRFGCSACNLYSSCQAPFMRPYVPRGWTGRLLLVGEAPGEDEDSRSGRPFTGRAGALLRKLYLAAGYSDLDVGFVNAVRCRPKDNASPTMQQVRACRAFLLRVIEQTRPQFILALGNTALAGLTNSGDGNITKSRGKLLRVPGLFGDGAHGGDRGDAEPTFVLRCYATYHPAAILHGATHLAARIQEDLERLEKGQEEWPVDAEPSGRLLAVDTEYSPAGDLLTVGLADAERAIAYEQPEIGRAAGALADCEYIAGHSVAGDVIQLVDAGLPVREEWVTGAHTRDSLLLARMVDENDLSYELETQLLGTGARIAPWKAFTRSISETDATLWPPDLRKQRCRLDAWAARRVAEHYSRSLPNTPLVEYTHRIASTLERLSLAGAFVSMDRFEANALGYEKEVERCRDELIKVAAVNGVEDFSPTNDNHLRTLLYDRLGLPVLRKTTKDKLPAVDKLTLKGLNNEVADLLATYSRVDKLYSVNAVGLRELLRPCGRLNDTPVGWLPFHINPLGARTGRRASSNPNSQNWPRSVRGIVRSRFPGGSIGDFDYQKLEVVLIAWVSGDERLLRDFTVGRGYFDVAAGVLGIEVVKDTPPYRAVKSIALGVHYNMQTPKMARQLWDGVIDDKGDLVVVRFSPDYKTHEREVDKLRRAYLARYPMLRAYMEKQESLLLSEQFVVSYTGRVRHLPLTDSYSTPGFGHLLNQAINFPIQSLASDVTGSALLDIEEQLLALEGLSYLQHLEELIAARKYTLTNEPGSAIMYPVNRTLLFNEVHDSLILDFHPDHVKRDTELVVECMRAVKSLRRLAPGFDLALGVDYKISPFWGGK